MTAANMPISTRYHGLDFMRAGMMLMGILLHAGVMYMPLPYGHDSAAIIADPLDPYRDISGYSGVVQRIVMTYTLFSDAGLYVVSGIFWCASFPEAWTGYFLKEQVYADRDTDGCFLVLDLAGRPLRLGVRCRDDLG